MVNTVDRQCVSNQKFCLISHQSLLPVGCVRSIPYSAQYEEAYKCNFLGLSPDVPIPTHVSSSGTTREAAVILHNVQLPGCVDLTFFSSEFSVLVDVSSEGSGQNSAVGNDDVSSLYQFTISSANTQPADRGERPSHNDFILFNHSQIPFTGLKGNKGIPASTEKVVFSTGAFVMNLNYSHKYIISLY